jgi:hypothetical protein
VVDQLPDLIACCHKAFIFGAFSSFASAGICREASFR